LIEGVKKSCIITVNILNRQENNANNIAENAAGQNNLVFFQSNKEKWKNITKLDIIIIILNHRGG
jgi:hypothetical protein